MGVPKVRITATLSDEVTWYCEVVEPLLRDGVTQVDGMQVQLVEGMGLSEVDDNVPTCSGFAFSQECLASLPLGRIHQIGQKTIDEESP